MKINRILFSFLVSITLAACCNATSNYSRQEDVIYARKDGMALTMDVFSPTQNSNGIGIIHVVSGGWYSSHAAISPEYCQPFVDRGYTVFAVCHGSQPMYTIPDAIADMQKSVRFIRSNAEKFKIDPDKIGVTGGSAGGHLSLMLGVLDSTPEPNSPDALMHYSAKVQAVACFFPPTDFLNYGKQGEIALGNGILKNFPAPFDFRELSGKIWRYRLITEEARRLEIGKQISPIYHATKDDAPTLIIHGDADNLVPIQQSQSMIQALNKINVEAHLVTKPGAGHGWQDIKGDLSVLADFFDKHLKNEK